jgi:hypothetical protein
MHRLYERFAIQKNEVEFLLRNRIYLFSGFERNNRYGHFLMYSHFDNDFIIPVISKDLYNIVTVLKIAFDTIVHSFASQEYVKNITIDFVNSRQIIIPYKIDIPASNTEQETLPQINNISESVSIRRREEKTDPTTDSDKKETKNKPIKQINESYKKSIVYRLNLDLSIEYTYNDPRLIKDVNRSTMCSVKFNESAFNELTEEMKRQLKSVSTIREGFRLTDKNKVSIYSVLYFSSTGDTGYVTSIHCDWTRRSLAHLRYKTMCAIYNFIRFVEKDPLIFIVPRDIDGNPIEYRLFYTGFYKNSKVNDVHEYTGLPKDKIVS